MHGPDGAHPDPLISAREYEEQLRAAGPVAVQVLGIGGNGHIGFNEPGSSLSSVTRVKTLTEQTRRDNSRFFAGVEDVPRHVITQGLGTISRAEHLVLTAAGDGKAAAVAAAVEGPLTASCPASVLQFHPHATVVVDEAAAAGLERADQTVSAGLAGEEIGRLLGIPGSGPVLTFDRMSLSRGDAVEHTRSWYRADRYELCMSLDNNGPATAPARGVAG